MLDVSLESIFFHIEMYGMHILSVGFRNERRRGEGGQVTSTLGLLNPLMILNSRNNELPEFSGRKDISSQLSFYIFSSWISLLEIESPET
jgi:hypothetical protein